MSQDAAILDMDNPKVKRMVLDHIKHARGLHRFVFKRCRAQRSLQANAMLWGVAYKAIQAGLLEAWGEHLSIEQVHWMMKRRELSQPIVNRKTGEILGEKIESTASSSTS
jgi:hypothetical protein